MYWNDLVRRDGGDRERAVVAGDADARDRDRVAHLERVDGALVAIVTVLPFSSAPPREVALGAALMLTLSGWIAAVRE